MLANFSETMLLSNEEWGYVVEHEPPPKLYMDTVLKNDKAAYRLFVKDLWDRGMVKFKKSPRYLITPFFVAKKDGTLRLVWDCRVVNR